MENGKFTRKYFANRFSHPTPLSVCPVKAPIRGKVTNAYKSQSKSTWCLYCLQLTIKLYAFRLFKPIYLFIVTIPNGHFGFWHRSFPFDNFKLFRPFVSLLPSFRPLPLTLLLFPLLLLLILFFCANISSSSGLNTILRY